MIEITAAVPRETLSRLTEAQARVLAFIGTYIGSNGYPPTRSEIAAHFGFASINGVCKDDPAVIPGSQTKCSTLEDGKDNWLAKSAIFTTPIPPPPVDDGKGYIRVTVLAGDTKPTTWGNTDTPIQPGAEIWIRLYEGDQLIESVPWAPRLSVVRTYQDRTKQVCFSAALFIDINRNGIAEGPLVIDDISFYEEAGRTLESCKEPEPPYQMTVLIPPGLQRPVFERVRADEVPR